MDIDDILSLLFLGGVEYNPLGRASSVGTEFSQQIQTLFSVNSQRQNNNRMILEPLSVNGLQG